MTREAVRLQGRLAGSKRKRKDDEDFVVPQTNGVTHKSGETSDSEAEESRVKAVSKKERPVSIFDKFSAPSTKKKKKPPQLHSASTSKPTPGPTASESDPSKPQPTPSSTIPILFPPPSPVQAIAPQRTPSPTRSTPLSFPSSSRSLSRAAQRSLRKKALHGTLRIEVIDLETPVHQQQNARPTSEPPSPSPPKGKGKKKKKRKSKHTDEQETPVTPHFVPPSNDEVIDLDTPQAKARKEALEAPPHTPPHQSAHEGSVAIGLATPQPPRIRRLHVETPEREAKVVATTTSASFKRPVLQLEPITPTAATAPHGESDSPNKKKRKRKRKKKKKNHQPEEPSTSIPELVDLSSDEETPRKGP